MPIDYQFDDRGFVLVRVEGQPSFDEMQACTDAYRSAPAYEPGMPILVDDRARTAPPSVEEIRALAEQASQGPEEEQGQRCAMLVEQDIQFGMSRMWSSLTDEKARTIEVFRDEQEAITWLLRRP